MNNLKKQNNYAYIDSQNLNLAIKDLGWKLDFERFRKYIKDKYSVTKAYLFIGYVPENQQLYTNLQKYGYILVFKPTLKLPNKLIKGNVDAELVLHASIDIPYYDKAVIVSGDGDFHCLVEHLNSIEKLEKLIIPNKKQYSSLFRRFNKKILFMNSLEVKLGFKTKKRGIN